MKDRYRSHRRWLFCACVFAIALLLIDHPANSQGVWSSLISAKPTNSRDKDGATLVANESDDASAVSISYTKLADTSSPWTELNPFTRRLDHGYVASPLVDPQHPPRLEPNGADESDWDQRTVWGYLEDPLAKGPFIIDGISLRDGRLRATAGYLDPEATSATVIEGTQTPKEYLPEVDVWAEATLQVANDPEGEWKTVGPTPGKAATITIPPKAQSMTTINVGVDILRPMIGQFGYGRAVLKNGQAAPFELINLLPPRSAAEHTHADKRTTKR